MTKSNDTPDTSDFRCTSCRTVIPFARTVGLTCCPECGTTDIPQRVGDDLWVELYQEEFDLVFTYARLHSLVIDKGEPNGKYLKTINSIISHINKTYEVYNINYNQVCRFNSNIHDLHILLVWAENHARELDNIVSENSYINHTDNRDKIDRISQLIESQLPAEKWKPLTLTRELRDLRENLQGKVGGITLTDSKGEETKF